MGDLDGDLDIAQAAAHLGITPDAVRKRIRRGTLRAYKKDDRWYVVLGDQDGNQDAVQDSDLDHNQDSVQDATWTTDLEVALEGYRELVQQLRNENARLCHELDARTEELRRKDVLIASLVQRLPEQPAIGAADRAMLVERERTNPPTQDQNGPNSAVQRASTELNEQSQSEAAPTLSMVCATAGQETSSGGVFKRFWRWLTQPG